MVVSQRSETRFETPYRVRMVELKIVNQVLTRDHTRRAAASKNYLGIPTFSLNGMSFKEGNWEKRNLFKLPYRSRIYLQMPQETGVNGVLFCLIPKQFQRNICERTIVYLV